MNPNGRSAPEVTLDAWTWCARASTTGTQGRLRRETGLLVLFEGCCQGYSPYETQIDGPPIWGMSVKRMI